MSPSPIQKVGEETAAVPRIPALRLDLLLLLATVGLLACSLITIGTATRDDVPGSPHFYLDRQAVYAVVGLVLMLVLSRIDYSRLRELKYGLYALMIGSIMLVLGLGSAARGSRRAFSLPFISFQPSELGKVLLILAISAFVVDRVRRLRDRDTTARTMLLALFPSLLVILQPDLGTGMVYVVVALAVLFVAGTSWRHFAVLGVVFVVSVTLVLGAAPAMGVQLLKPYQVQRLTGFLSPSNDPGDQTYQLNQSRIAIGSGEKTGRGPAGATQTKLNFLPEHHTDFIFAVVGETYGFIGVAVVLSLFALLIWRCMRILTMAKNLYGVLIAGGVLSMVAFQVFVNVGMNVGIMPITGVTLPLMSYGGSSVLVTLMALGLVQSVYVQGRKNASAKGRVLVD